MIWFFDIRNPERIPSASRHADTEGTAMCAKAGISAPKNIPREPPGSFVSSELIFATYQNAGSGLRHPRSISSR